MLHSLGPAAVLAAPPALWVPPPDLIPRTEPAPKGAVALALPLSASANPLGPAAAPAPAEKKRRTRVTVFPTNNAQVPDASAVAVLRSLSEALRRNERLDMKDLDVRLSDFAQEVPSDQVDLARQTFQKGQEALERREHGAAIPQLEDSIDQLAQVLPYVKKQELADAQLALALAQLRAGNRRASNTTLLRLMTWRPEYEPDPGQIPGGRAARRAQAARQAVARAEHSDLRVNSDPPGAQVFVDGVFLGVTPAVASDLLVGEHYITYKKLGFKKALRIAQVSTRSKSAVQAKLALGEVPAGQAGHGQGHRAARRAAAGPGGGQPEGDALPGPRRVPAPRAGAGRAQGRGADAAGDGGPLRPAHPQALEPEDRAAPAGD